MNEKTFGLCFMCMMYFQQHHRKCFLKPKACPASVIVSECTLGLLVVRVYLFNIS